MTKNQMVIVKKSHRYHPGRKGYFLFYGEGPSKGTVVLAASPYDENTCSQSELFAVGEEDIES